jgi:hypothetical protein
VLLALVLLSLLGVGCSGDDADSPTEPAAPGASVVIDDEASTAITGPEERDLGPYEGLGTWVDVFDYLPAYQDPGRIPLVSPESLPDMAALGVGTLYLQAARDDPRSPGELAHDDLTPAMLVAAHEAGIRVVAWYLPKLGDVDGDLRRLRTLLEYEVDGHRFDGVAVDIEDTLTVPDTETRNRRLVQLSRRLDELAGDDPIGGIVLPPVVLEVVNTAYWPSFPWRDIADHYDVWLPMSYWTNRTIESGYHDGYVYTDENVRRMLANLGDPDAPLHPIGGIGDTATADAYRDFVRAATQHDALGWSIYDFATQSSASWEHLRERP